MRRDGKVNIKKQKNLARQKYAERQIDKFTKWSWEVKGYIKYKDIVKKHNEYNIKCYG